MSANFYVAKNFDVAAVMHIKGEHLQTLLWACAQFHDTVALKSDELNKKRIPKTQRYLNLLTSYLFP